MSQAIGTISDLDGGKFYAKSEDGSLRELSIGDIIFAGEAVTGDKLNNLTDTVVVALYNAGDVSIKNTQEQLFDSSLFQAKFSEDETVTHDASVIDMLKEYNNEVEIQNTDDSNLDTLIMEEVDVDLSSLDANSSNYEVLDLTKGDHNISISIEDVINITDADNILRIEGDSSDTVNIGTNGSEEWTLSDFKTDVETGSTYHEYTSSNGDSTVIIEINTNIEIDQS